MQKITIIALIYVLILASQISLVGQNISTRYPVLEARFRQAIELYNSKEYDKAILIFEEIINDDSVFYKRSQLAVYASMWIGNAFVKSGQVDKAYSAYLPGLYCYSQPINPDDFIAIDSISLVGRYYYDKYFYHGDGNSLILSLEQFKKRQKLLETSIGKNHLWANGGRSVLFYLYGRCATYLNMKNNEYDLARTLAYTDTIASLGYESYNCLKLNFAERTGKQATYFYYYELMSLLDDLCWVNFINNYYDISYSLLSEIDSLVKANPEFSDINENHWYKWATINYKLRYLDEADGAPSNKFNTEPLKFCKIAEESYLKYLDKIKLNSDFEMKYKALEGLMNVYYFVSSAVQDLGTDSTFKVSDFKYDFYKIEDVTDSLTQKEYDKINMQGITNLVVDHFDINILDRFSLNCKYEDLDPYQKKYIDVWEQIIELLKENDFGELVRECSGDTPYNRCNLITDELSLYFKLQKEFKKHLDLEAIDYYRMRILYRIVKDYRTLCSPLYDPFMALSKYTYTQEELVEFLEKYISYYNLYVSEYNNRIADIEKIGDEYANSINRDYLDTEYEYAYMLFKLAERSNRTILYIYALHALEKVVKIKNYDPCLYEIDNLIDICKIKLNNYEGYTNMNSKLIKEFNSLLTTFKYATAVQRNSLWDSFMVQLNECLAYSLLNTDDPKAAILVYNSLLFKKGVLLASDKNFTDVLNASQITDPLFIEKREIFKQLISNGQDIDSLATVERQLQPYLRNIDYNNNLICSWTDIQKVLRKDEVAIEFGTLNCIGKEYLFATLINTEKESPILINFNEINFTGPLDIESVKIIERKLHPYLQNCSTIYFSPDGYLYNLPLEHLIEDDKTWIRLTSTRYLKGSRQNVYEKSMTRKIALFGGLDYNIEIHENKKLNTDTTSMKRDLPYRLRDGGATYLPYTYVEVNLIDSIAKFHKISSSIYSGINGTESNFRFLIQNEDDIGILHFATHGFYWTKSEVRNYKNLRFIFPEDKSGQTDDETLNRSGLLLSGANCGLRGYLHNDLYSDGILTSKEISSLDLHNLDMAVLSACQTGLGEITSDGVFGLQRGFKKAGVHTLLMSLWKVDDKATQMLMTAFYDNLTNGMSKLESLKEAQRSVREYKELIEIKEEYRKPITAQEKAQKQAKKSEKIYKEIKLYAHPRYWAGFILLDAIN